MKVACRLTSARRAPSRGATAETANVRCESAWQSGWRRQKELELELELRLQAVICEYRFAMHSSQRNRNRSSRSSSRPCGWRANRRNVKQLPFRIAKWAHWQRQRERNKQEPQKPRHKKLNEAESLEEKKRYLYYMKYVRRVSLTLFLCKIITHTTCHWYFKFKISIRNKKTTGRMKFLSSIRQVYHWIKN